MSSVGVAAPSQNASQPSASTNWATICPPTQCCSPGVHATTARRPDVGGVRIRHPSSPRTDCVIAVA